MGWLDIFKRAAPAVEKRSAASGFTAEIIRQPGCDLRRFWRVAGAAQCRDDGADGA
jgi:hypothetical protein